MQNNKECMMGCDKIANVQCTMGCLWCACCVHQQVGEFTERMKCVQDGCKGKLVIIGEWCKCCPIQKLKLNGKK